jgi:CHAT domain-containing protein/predicted negative regulator of RcsB-dependent stress response
MMSRRATLRFNSGCSISRILCLGFSLISLFLHEPTVSRNAQASVSHLNLARSSPQQAQQNTSAPSSQQVTVLELGKPIERELAGGQSHSYQLTLAAGQLLYAVVEQRGIDVVVILFGPDGKKWAEVDSPNGTRGPEPLKLVTETPGIYRLEVRTLDKRVAAGRYEVKIEELREATPSDRNRLAAEKARSEGVRLANQRTGESRQRAVEKFEEALSLLRTVDDRAGEAGTLHALGTVYYELNENQKALDYLRRALSLRRVVKDRRGEADTLNVIGGVYGSLGEHQRAIDQYNQALTIFRSVGNRRWIAYSLNNIGYTYNSLGEKQRAIDYYEQAIPIFRAEAEHYGQANTLNNSGFIYRDLGQNQKALDCFIQARQLYQAIGDRGGEAHSLHSIADIHVMLGEFQKALDHCEQTISLARAAGNLREEVSAVIVVGKAYHSMSEHQKAIESFSQALKLWRALGERSGEVSTLQHIARAQRDRGNLAEARTQIEEALAIAESLRNKVINQELRSSYFALVQGAFEFHIDLFMRSHKQSPSAGFDAAALRASERARARSLLELLAEARADIRQGVDPKLLESEREWQRKLSDKEQQRIRVLRSRPTPEQVATVEKEMRTLLAEYQDLQAQIRATSPRYGALTQPVPLSLKEIQQQALDDETLLLEYSLGEERSFLWAVTTNSITSFELPRRKEIEEAALRVYDLLTARSRVEQNKLTDEDRTRLEQARAQYPEAARALSQMLLGPVAPQLGKKRLLIVADGALQYLPFAALPLPRDNPSVASQKDAADPIPLIVEHEVVSLPSASTIAVLRSELAGRPQAPKLLAVLADPVFGPDDKRVKSKAGKASTTTQSGARSNEVIEQEVFRSAREAGIMDDDSNLKRLVFTREEANRIVALAPAGSSFKALDFNANRAAATSAGLSQYRIVHFATHGLLNSRHPEFSGIVFSLMDQRGESQNGFLRLHDVYNLRLSADLVVLSACSTALGKDVRGEGLIGLTRGFMYAGAARVVASLWRVDDAATRELMARFYQGMLKEKMRPAAALRAAQIAMWKQQRWQHPFYWAAFVHQGEWR